jgi:hypothetical protein
MGQGPDASRDRLSRRQRRNLDRLERELVADVDLCCWFDRLASGNPSATPGVRAVRQAARFSRARGSGAIASAVFGALVLVGATLTVACLVLQVTTLAAPAIIALMLAPVSVLVVQGSSRHGRGAPAARSPRSARPGEPPARWSHDGMWNGREGGMWLLP